MRPTLTMLAMLLASSPVWADKIKLGHVCRVDDQCESGNCKLERANISMCRPAERGMTQAELKAYWAKSKLKLICNITVDGATTWVCGNGGRYVGYPDFEVIVPVAHQYPSPLKPGEKSEHFPCKSDAACDALATELGASDPFQFVCKKAPTGFEAQWDAKLWGSHAPYCFRDKQRVRSETKVVPVAPVGKLDVKKAIVGTWLTGASDIPEFFADGKVEVSFSGSDKLVGTYKWIAADTIESIYKNNGEDLKSTSKVVIEGDTLQLIDRKGKIKKHTRRK